MARIDRLPALPLIANDPYFSIWMPADKLTDTDSAHWAGATKPLKGTAVIDGKEYRFLGTGEAEAMETAGQFVNPTSTVVEFQAAGVELSVRFTSPALQRMRAGRSTSFISTANVLTVPAGSLPSGSMSMRSNALLL